VTSRPRLVLFQAASESHVPLHHKHILNVSNDDHDIVYAVLCLTALDKESMQDLNYDPDYSRKLTLYISLVSKSAF